MKLYSYETPAGKLEGVGVDIGDRGYFTIQAQPYGYGMAWPTDMKAGQAIKAVGRLLLTPEVDDMALAFTSRGKEEFLTTDIEAFTTSNLADIEFIRANFVTAGLSWSRNPASGFAVNDVPLGGQEELPTMTYGDTVYQRERVAEILAHTLSKSFEPIVPEFLDRADEFLVPHTIRLLEELF